MNRKPKADQYIEIAKLIANDECVLFLGSGISRGEKGEIGLPSVEELAIDLFKEIKNEKPFLRDWERKNLAKIASFFEIIKGKPALDGYIKNRFLQVKNPLQFHKLVSQLPFKIIITTNYDRLLESQFDFDKKDYIPIVEEADITHWGEQKIILFKIHGCVTRPRALIISEDDYIRYLSRNSLFHDILKFLFCTKSILFIGYSLSDINVRIILQTVEYLSGEREKKHYLIQNGVIHEKIFSDLSKKNIEIFKVNAVNFLEELIKTFKNLKIEEKLGNKFDFYIDKYRLSTATFVKDKVLKRFAKDIKDGEVYKDDYEYWGQLIETFGSKENQEELSKIIKEEKGVDIVLKIVSQINIDRISDEIITQFNDLLARTDNESLKIAILEYLYKNNQLKPEILPVLESWKRKYPTYSDMNILLNSVLGTTINS